MRKLQKIRSTVGRNHINDTNARGYFASKYNTKMRFRLPFPIKTTANCCRNDHRLLRGQERIVLYKPNALGNPKRKLPLKNIQEFPECSIVQHEKLTGDDRFFLFCFLWECRHAIGLVDTKFLIIAEHNQDPSMMPGVNHFALVFPNIDSRNDPKYDQNYCENARKKLGFQCFEEYRMDETDPAMTQLPPGIPSDSYLDFENRTATTNWLQKLFADSNDNYLCPSLGSEMCYEIVSCVHNNLDMFGRHELLVNDRGNYIKELGDDPIHSRLDSSKYSELLESKLLEDKWHQDIKKELEFFNSVFENHVDFDLMDVGKKLSELLPKMFAEMVDDVNHHLNMIRQEHMVDALVRFTKLEAKLLALKAKEDDDGDIATTACDLAGTFEASACCTQKQKRRKVSY